MNKDSLLEKIKTLLHEAGILDKIISKFIDIVNSEDKDITFGLVLTVVGDNVDLAHEVFEIVKQIEENKKQEFVNKKKVEKNNEVKTIPWKNFNSLADFANNFHIDHSIILKLISDYKLNKNISNEMLKNGASHIGYGIRPTEREKGYAKIALYLALLEEQKLGEENVLLECTIDNIGSNRTIQALGGKLEKTELDSYDNTMTNYYWINVNDSVKNYFNSPLSYDKSRIIRDI